MKGVILLILGIIVALIVVGGAVGYTYMQEIYDDADTSTEDKISNIVASTVSDDDSNTEDDGDDIVSEEIKFNAQEGEGYYREVTYKDGGFRQYDVDTGKLIGSSYDSDQKYLPSME